MTWSDLLLFIAHIEYVFLENLSPAAKKRNKKHEKITKLVASAGLEPALPNGQGFSYYYNFRYQPKLFVVWTIPSSQRDANRLVSTPSYF